MNDAKRRWFRTALVLLLPIATYLAVYILPLLSVATYSVDNGVLHQRFPHLGEWVETGDPVNDDAARRLLDDLATMEPKDRAESGRMLNQEQGGFRSLIMSTGGAAGAIVPTLAALVAFDSRWGEDRYWQILRRNVEPITWRHFQLATGLKPDARGQLSFASGDGIYPRIMLRTLSIGFQVALLTLLIGYPLAYAIANGRRLPGLVLSAVLLSFWTSILVRTTAWVVLLQTNGLINKLLIQLGLIVEPLQLIFNRFGTVIAMTHVLLPFAILPIVNVMNTIPTSQADASRSLGAGPVETFLRVYFPQTLRGVAVGGGTVFILSLGFYVTPALVGGPGDQMLAYYIAEFMQKYLNWGMASTLSILLMGCVVLLLVASLALHRLSGRQQRTV